MSELFQIFLESASETSQRTRKRSNQARSPQDESESEGERHPPRTKTRKQVLPSHLDQKSQSQLGQPMSQAVSQIVAKH